jgi:hypothetical protein
MMHLIDKAIEKLEGEDEKLSNNVNIRGKLVELAPVGVALVVGDLHGDLNSLTQILENSKFLDKMTKDPQTTLIFLGDYGDRGNKSPELYYSLLSLKLSFPKQIIILRGNHEGPTDLIASPHDLTQRLEKKFKEKWIPLYQKIRELFNYFYLAVYVKERYLMLHGGIPVKARGLEDVINAEQMHPQKTFLEEILWNDPDEQVKGTYPSPRGAGNLFGETITEDFLAKINAKILIRGHESAMEGFKINHDGKVLTLFSRKGDPYFNSHGSYLELSLSEKFQNANQLIPYIHKI